MPVHVTTDTAQTITGNKTFTGSVSTSAGFTFPDGKTQTIAFTGVTIPPSDRLNNGNVQIVLSSDNNLHFPTGTIGDTLSDGGFTIVGKPGYYAELASHDGNVFAWASDANYANPVGGGFSIGTDTTDLSGGYIWTFGNDGLLRFPDGSIQPTAFTNNLSAYLPLAGGNINGNVTISGTISSNNPIYAKDGNSDQWNAAFAAVQSNSATAWNYQGTDVKALSSNWQAAYTSLTSTSANWNDTRNTVQNNSATTWNPAGVYLPLSGGTVSGPSRFDSNVTIFGNLSCSGTQTFQNTIFSTTSAVSVVHTGSGPALWVGNNGTGDIASFYDIDQNVEVLHVGGNNGTFPNVGVKTSTPNVDFTVSGAISASSTIYSASGDSNQWNSSYNTIQTNSATTWNYQGTDVKNLTGNWQSSYTALTSTSANWNDTRSTVQTNSATTWNYQGTDVKSLTANWQNTYTTFSAQSANNLSVYSTVNANSATWGTGGGGGGLTIFSEVSSVTSLNNTIPTFGLSAKSLSANVDFAIIPKGSGALLAQIPDGSSVGGNKRGLYATDWQRVRAVASQVASSDYATIGGGSSNTASGEYSTIGGGSINRAASDYITIGGGTSNTALSSYATIGGGSNNIASAESTTIGGGSVNIASGENSTIGGGATNSAEGANSTVGGGGGNTASTEAATVGGGNGNTASGIYTTVGGGRNNIASGENSTIGGGSNNIASGANSYIAGGSNNNTNNQANTFILGSSITAPSANYTYVNNLSSQGDIRASSTIYSASGNSNQWNSTYSTVQSNSASWGGGGGSFTVEDANTIIGLSMFL